MEAEESERIGVDRGRSLPTIGTESLFWFRGCFSVIPKNPKYGGECCEAAAHTITALLRYYFTLCSSAATPLRTANAALGSSSSCWLVPIFRLPQHDDDKAGIWNLEGAAQGFSMNLCLKPVHGRSPVDHAVT